MDNGIRLLGMNPSIKGVITIRTEQKVTSCVRKTMKKKKPSSNETVSNDYLTNWCTENLSSPDDNLYGLQYQISSQCMDSEKNILTVFIIFTSCNELTESNHSKQLMHHAQ